MRLPAFVHDINPKRKHTYLHIENDGTVIVKSPGISDAAVERLLIHKSAWIKKAQARMLAKKGHTDALLHACTLWLRGNAYPLHHRHHMQRKTYLRFENDSFTLYRYDDDETKAQRALTRFYTAILTEALPPLISHYSEAMGLFPARYRIRKTKRQWGSCSSSDILSFNSALAKVPQEALVYVVVHELAHIRHKNHSQAFWSLVQATLPDYKERQAILKEYLT